MPGHRPHSEYHGCNVILPATQRVDPTIIPAKDRGAIVPEVRRALKRASPPGLGEAELDRWHTHHVERYCQGSSRLNGWLGRNKMYCKGYDPVAPRWAGAPIRCMVEAVQHLFCGKLNRVWRGVTMTDTKLAVYMPNVEVQWQAFSSTSLSERQAREFAGRGLTHATRPVLFEIRRDRRRPTAARIDRFASQYEGEKEVLMIPGCRFKVVDVSTEGELNRIVLQEIASPYEEMGWIELA